MTVDQTSVIDYVSVRPDGVIVLTISDPLDWEDEGAHVLLLQDKINAYLRFVESGEILEHVPDARGKPVLISICGKHEPTPFGREFLSRCRPVLEAAGFRLAYETLVADEASTTQSFRLEISYGQIAIFASRTVKPFSLWTDRHVNQGFAWRPDSSSFRTLDDGTHDVQVKFRDEDPGIAPDAVRVIEVPFHVPPRDIDVIVASISDERGLRLPAGDYRLRFEAIPAALQIAPKIVLTLLPPAEEPFRLVRTDADLSPAEPLDVTADPA